MAAHCLGLVKVWGTRVCLRPTPALLPDRPNYKWYQLEKLLTKCISPQNSEITLNPLEPYILEVSEFLRFLIKNLNTFSTPCLQKTIFVKADTKVLEFTSYYISLLLNSSIVSGDSVDHEEPAWLAEFPSQ